MTLKSLAMAGAGLEAGFAACAVLGCDAGAAEVSREIK